MLNASDDLSPAAAAIEPSWRARATVSGRDAFVIVGLVALAFATAYLPVLRILTHQWATNDTYSFGVLVPFISAYLIWSRRDRLLTLPVAPSPWGIAIVGVAGGVLLLGRMTAIIGFQELSLVLMLVGLVVLILGFPFLRVLWFPLAYLLLMLPVWEVVTDGLEHPSQLLSARLAHQLLQMAGIPVHRSEQYLHLPTITLEVASACSGINFLIAVIAIGLPQAYLRLRGWVPRAAVVAFAVMIALLSNGLRVAIIGALSYYELSAAVHGPGHILQGLFVSGIGVLALLASVSILARRYPRLQEADAPSASTPRPGGADRRRLLAAGGTAIVVLLAIAVFRPEYSTAAANPDVTAFRLDERWRELPGTVPARFVAGVIAGGRPARVFQAPKGELVELFIGNLAHRGSDGELTYRAVELPRDVSVSQIELGSESAPLRVNRATFMQAGRQTSVHYWYDLGGRTAARHTTAKAYTVGRMLMGSEKKARLVVVVSELPTNTIDDASVVNQFVRDVARTRASAEDDLSK